MHNYYLCMLVYYFACKNFTKMHENIFRKQSHSLYFVPQGRELLTIITLKLCQLERERERDAVTSWFMVMHDRMQIRLILILWNSIDSFIASDSYISKQKVFEMMRTFLSQINLITWIAWISCVKTKVFEIQIFKIF